MSSTDSRTLYPVFAMLLGAAMWGVAWFPIRLLEQGGLHGLLQAFLLYAVAFAISLPWLWRGLADFGRHPGQVTVMILAGGWTNVAFVLAILDGNVLRVMLLFYLSPLWSTLLGWFFLRERIARAALAGLALAMVGAVVMLWRPEQGLPWPSGTADWLALSAGLAFSISNTMTRAAQQVSVAAKTQCVFVGVALIAGVMAFGSGDPIPRVELSVAAGAAALGIGILAMTALVQYAVTHIPVHRSAVLALVELVAGAISQQLLTDEVVTVREWVGGLLIVLGAYLVARVSTKAPDSV